METAFCLSAPAAFVCQLKISWWGYYWKTPAWTVLPCHHFTLITNFVTFFFSNSSYLGRTPGRLRGAFQSRWVDPKENFLPRDLLIGGWFPCHFPVIVAPVCGACPALLSVDAPSVLTALRALWLKPDYLHCEGWALGRRTGGLGVAESRGWNSSLMAFF